MLWYTVELRAAHGDTGSDYTIERVRDVCTTLLAHLQERQDKETASTGDLMLSEVRLIQQCIQVKKKIFSRDHTEKSSRVPLQKIY